MSEKQLSVRLYGNPIGVLKQDEAGKISFTYNPDASFAISLKIFPSGKKLDKIPLNYVKIYLSGIIFTERENYDY